MLPVPSCEPCLSPDLPSVKLRCVVQFGEVSEPIDDHLPTDVVLDFLFQQGRTLIVSVWQTTVLLVHFNSLCNPSDIIIIFIIYCIISVNLAIALSEITVSPALFLISPVPPFSPARKIVSYLSLVLSAALLMHKSYSFLILFLVPPSWLIIIFSEHLAPTASSGLLPVSFSAFLFFLQFPSYF